MRTGRVFSTSSTVMTVSAILMAVVGFAAAGIMRPMELKGVPPEMDKSAPTRFRLPIGHKSFKFTCPVLNKDSGVMIQWTKDGESIVDWDTDYKVLKENQDLRIKNLRQDNSGRYECEAVNGFGRSSIEFTLQVYNPEIDEITARDRMTLTDRESAPAWNDEAEMRAEMSMSKRVNIGGKLELRCPARGNPIPVIKWYHNGTELAYNALMNSAVFVIESVRAVNSGNYSCQVWNKLGIKEARFKVFASDFFDANQLDTEDPLVPVIDEPVNVTIRDGHTAQFLCKAKASHKPVIKWLKQVDNPEYIRARQANATLIYANGMHLLVIDNPQIKTDQQFEGNSYYTNRIVMPSVKVEQQGKYICVVTSPQGHIVYRTAHLIVEPSMHWKSLNLFGDTFWLITIPLVIGVILLVTVAVCYLRYNSAGTNKGSSVTSSNPPPPPRIPPPMAPADHVYPEDPNLMGPILYDMSKPRSPVVLRDSMFQPRHATLDRLHTPHRLHRGYRDEEVMYMHQPQSPNPGMYWTQPKYSHQVLVAPPPSSNYRTLDVAYCRDPPPTVYSSEYSEQSMPFLSNSVRRDL